MLKTAAKFVLWLNEKKPAPRGQLILNLVAGIYVGLFLAANLMAKVEAPTLALGSMLSKRDLLDAPSYWLPNPSSIQAPPYEKRNEARAIVEFAWPDSVPDRCGDKNAAACMVDIPDQPTLVLPNPCWFTYESYAAMACHELGHINGWRHEKGPCNPTPDGETSWQCETIRKFKDAGYKEIGRL